MSNTYDVGDKPRLKSTFTTSDVAADPTAVTFKLKEPDGTITTYVYGTDAQLVKSATGIFYVDFLIDQEGEHWYTFIGSGSVAAADEKSFYAEQSIFT